jgi:3-hydroxyanthranilate 3,4-dioxygenase
MIHKPINFKKWIDNNRHLLKPPVANKVVWKDGEYIVMVVGGPNNRKDYHYNETPEYFHQIEGDMVLKIIDNGTPKNITIKEGEIFILPAKIPHSPQRFENTIGLVIEYPREKNMLDALEWYCEKCNEPLYRETFALKDIETDMPGIFDAYYSNKERCTCKKCGHYMNPPSLKK